MSLNSHNNIDRSQSVDSQGIASTSKAEEELFWSIPSRDSEQDNAPQTLPQIHTASSDAPLLPHRDRNLSTNTESADPNSPLGLSPHPDDKPAPLFASRPEASVDADSALHTSSKPATAAVGSRESIDTTIAEEGDSGRSYLPDTEANSGPHIENDVDGKPIVGDYLKMMFVEHQVVPTILVRFHDVAGTHLVNTDTFISRTFSFAFRGTTFFTM